MKKTNVLALTLLIAIFVLVGASCSTKKSAGKFTNTHRSTSTIDITGPSKLVKEYMKYTLGSIPSASVNYDKAKILLTPSLKKQFKDSMFVPTSYCIQDGPSEVRVASFQVDEKMNQTNVMVEANYGGEWKKMWSFKVVPVESGTWMINKIN
jgi:hypothetical protein